MVDAMVLIAFQHQSVVGAPAIGVDRALAGKHLAADHLDQFSLRAVHDRRAEDFSLPLEQTDDSNFSARSSASAPAHSTRPEIAFIHLDASSKRSGFAFGHFQHASPQQPVKTMRGILV